MRFASALLLAPALAATAALAAPSQLIFNEGDSSRGSLKLASSNKEPDFVDILESESKRLSSFGSHLSSAGSAMWPGTPSPGAPGSGGWVWSQCGSPSDLVKLESIEVSPDPPVPGKNMTVTAKGYLSGTVEDGSYADVVVKLGLIKLLSRRFDLCEEAKANNLSIQCPVSEGEYLVVHTVALPKEIPPAKFNVNVNAVNEADEDLVCLDLAIDFRNRA